MGTLFLPSLVAKKFLEIKNLSLAEATEFCNNFTARVKEKRKVKQAGADDTNLIIISDYLHTHPGYALVDDLDESEFFDVLAISTTSGVRGARPVFVDLERNVVGVGTTVVYNQNWASVNFDDNTLLATLDEYFETVNSNDDLPTSGNQDDDGIGPSDW
jgi:hypothetical protein